jgi:hypothetical protein
MLWLFGIFFPFWYFVARKIWQPWSERLNSKPRVPLGHWLLRKVIGFDTDDALFKEGCKAGRFSPALPVYRSD